MKEFCDESETIDFDDLLNASCLAKDYGVRLCRAAHAEIERLRREVASLRASRDLSVQVMDGWRKEAWELRERGDTYRARALVMRERAKFWRTKALMFGDEYTRLLERCASIVDDWLAKYPADVFTPPAPGQHGETVDACSAAALRTVLPEIAKEIRDLDNMLDGENGDEGKTRNCNAKPLTPTAQRVYNNDNGAARVERT